MLWLPTLRRWREPVTVPARPWQGGLRPRRGGPGPAAPAPAPRDTTYFLRRLLPPFFLAAFFSRPTDFFSRAISRLMRRAFAFALLRFRLAAALTFFNCAEPPEAFFRLRFAI